MDVTERCYETLHDLATYEAELRDCIDAIGHYRARVEAILHERGEPELPGILFTEIDAWLAKDR